MTRDPAPLGLTSTAQAHRRLVALIDQPVGLESVGLTEAAGRVLRGPVLARATQPPLAVSAMDGFALRAADAQAPGAALRVIARIAAGDAPGARLEAGEAARIFTGAAMPAGADAVALQEDVVEAEGVARLGEAVAPGAWVRKAGQDFTAGAALLTPPRRLSAEDVALAAAGGAAWLDVARRPRVVFFAMGDELRRPGEALPPAAIYASNQFGAAALAQAAGARAEIAPVTPDRAEAVEAALAAAAGADVLVTLGGASDGDHDLARPAFAALGADLALYKIAMRPGKPLSFGRLGRSIVLGLPGNPVSAMVCARLFLVPLIEALQGLPGDPPARLTLPLACALAEANGPREHFMRARRVIAGGGAAVAPFERQDSALLSVLASADCLMVRPPLDPPRAAGEPVEIVVLR